MKKGLVLRSGERGYGHLYRILGILNNLKSNLYYTVFVTNDVQKNFCGMPPVKWSAHWDMIVPLLGGLNDGWKARETRRYCAEASSS
jgi:hypothetical protein